MSGEPIIDWEGSKDEVRVCGSCGHRVASGASFCRHCGARFEEPVPRAARPERPGGRRITGPLAFLLLAIVITAVGLSALLLLGGGGPSSRTVVAVSNGSLPSEEAPPVTDEDRAGESVKVEGSPTAISESVAGSIAPGRYVQAGSFKFAADALAEQRRLRDDAIEVEVTPSDEAQELYPGFLVLLGGPLRSAAAEAALLINVRHDGVPSAFARSLTPARAASPSELGGGTWTGELEESSTSRPRLDRTLSVTFAASADGQEGKLTFTDPRCVTELRAEASAGPGLTYLGGSGCFAGLWRMRSTESGLMLAYLPADDRVVTGELHSG